jgi:hypothetical protein
MPRGLAQAKFRMLADDGFNEKLQEQKQKYQKAFENLPKTKEYIERTYYDLKNPSLSGTLFKNNEFWIDLASFVCKHQGLPSSNSNNYKPFLSEYFIVATTSITEMVCALAFMSLSFERKNHEVAPADAANLLSISIKDFDLLLY